MSDWTWEYVPDAANVVGGLAQGQIDQVESLAARIADAVAVRRIGTPFDVTEAVSNVIERSSCHPVTLGSSARTLDHCRSLSSATTGSS